MLEQSENDSTKIPSPPKLKWIEAANDTLDANVCIVKKAFLITRLLNSLGGHEDHLVRNDVARKGIEEI